MIKNTIKKLVHHCYWDIDMNCAKTMLYCLGKLFDVEIESQIMNSAIGLHGAGGFRAQCGLVEGSLMFIGIFFSIQKKNHSEITELCYQFAQQFTLKFSSLQCYDLRPNGFSKNDPPHACEQLTANAVLFTYDYIKTLLGQTKAL